MSNARWVCCPHCQSPVRIIRLGAVGIRGVRDSDLFRCTCCGKTFRQKGREPFPEGFRSKGL